MEVTSIDEARQILNELRNQVKSLAWARQVEDIQEQIEGRMETIMKPLGPSELVGNEFLKGEVSGMYTALGYADVAIEQLEAFIANASEEDLEL